MSGAFSRHKRIVVKIGSSTLTHESGHINLRRLEELVKTLADIKNSGREIIIVTSGAVAVGVGKLGLKHSDLDMPTKQAAASVGQCELMHLYDKLFGEYSHIVSQVLLTGDDIETDARRINIRNTFERLLQLDAIPIVNANDTVFVEEIRIGDNDTLSAMVARITSAHGLALLTDIDGLYDKDPRKYPDAKLVAQVTDIDESIIGMASGIGSVRGTGGMATKLQAARAVLREGIDMAIINGLKPRNLYRLIDGEQVGTYFRAKEI